MIYIKTINVKCLIGQIFRYYDSVNSGLKFNNYLDSYEYESY